MSTNDSKTLCATCRTLQPYEIRTVHSTRECNGKAYDFNKRVAFCKKCGNPVSVPSLDEFNEKEFEIKWREENDYIQIEDIYMILEKYDIDKRPLSNVLGFGEHTIENYLKGQLPNKNYSNMLRRILANYHYMQQLFEENKDKLNDRTSKRVEERINYHAAINSHNTKIESIALYILNSEYEITNMALQKLLYYIESFGQVMLGINLLDSQCEAWAHGPVYPLIYEKYKSFGASEITVDKIDDSINLDEKTKDIIDYVLKHFAIYNGFTLRNLTHAEEPWINAHAGYGERERCEEAITHDSITSYFTNMDKEYDLSTDSGVQNYIKSLQVI